MERRKLYARPEEGVRFLLNFFISAPYELEAEHERSTWRVVAGREHETNCALRIPELARAVGPAVDVVRRAVVRVFQPRLIPRRAMAMICPCPVARMYASRRFLACSEENINCLYRYHILTLDQYHVF